LHYKKTVHDHNSSLRIFALIDDVFKLLAEEMKLDLSHLMPSPQAAEDQKEGVESSSSLSQEVVDSEQDHVFSVPFNEQGLPIGINEPNQNLRKLDLNDGALLTITDGPDKGAKAVVIGRDKDGHYRLSIESTSQNSQESETRLLGRWWPQNAIDGEVSYIPVVNRTSA
jgi:hypothetical protein